MNKNKFKIQLIRSKKGNQKFRWRIVSCNGRITVSSEKYSHKAGPESVINSLLYAIKKGLYKYDGKWINDSDL